MRGLAPAVPAVFLGLSLTAGLAGIILPSMGWLPALGHDSLTLAAWRRLLAEPGLVGALWASLVSGTAATLLALVLAIIVTLLADAYRTARLVRRVSIAIVAVPHISIAIGLAFLLSPSGWLVRLFSPWLTGLEQPPVLAGEGSALVSLVIALALKETPFLTLALMAASRRIERRPDRAIARSLGYGPREAWLKILLPQLLRRTRLPLWAVLVYGLTNVEVAAILGPSTPPTLAILILRWFRDADLEQWLVASAGAVLMLVTVAATVLLWSCGERLAALLWRMWLRSGRSTGFERLTTILAGCVSSLLLAAWLACILTLIVWSLAGPWRFPDALPAAWSVRVWVEEAPLILSSAYTTLVLAAATSLTALLAAIATFEALRHEARSDGGIWLYLPLLLPQVAFLFGLQIVQIRIGVASGVIALMWMHLIYVLPYVLLMLRDPFRELDPRYERTARSLGRGRFVVLTAITLPLLRQPILMAFAIGFSVSTALYLPTLFGGGGRFSTLALEALPLAASGDRRIAASFGLVMAILPLGVLATAAILGGRSPLDERR